MQFSVELGTDGIILVGLLLALAVALSTALLFRERQRRVLADLCEALEAAGKEKNQVKINEAGLAVLIAFSHIRDRIQTGQ